MVYVPRAKSKAGILGNSWGTLLVYAMLGLGLASKHQHLTTNGRPGTLVLVDILRYSLFLGSKVGIFRKLSTLVRLNGSDYI